MSHTDDAPTSLLDTMRTMFHVPNPVRSDSFVISTVDHGDVVPWRFFLGCSPVFDGFRGREGRTVRHMDVAEMMMPCLGVLNNTSGGDFVMYGIGNTTHTVSGSFSNDTIETVVSARFHDDIPSWDMSPHRIEYETVFDAMTQFVHEEFDSVVACENATAVKASAAAGDGPGMHAIVTMFTADCAGLRYAETAGTTVGDWPVPVRTGIRSVLEHIKDTLDVHMRTSCMIEFRAPMWTQCVAVCVVSNRENK